MLALFALGVMSVFWMAVAAVAILVEKTAASAARRSPRVARSRPRRAGSLDRRLARSPAGAATSLIGMPRHADGNATVSWRISGSYFESCNCDAICPCRRTDGAPGGRSTHGICIGVLSWVIAEGSADGVDLSGPAGRDGGALRRRRARFAVELDPVPRRPCNRRPASRCSRRSSRAGSAATRSTHFPWAWKESRRIAVRSLDIEVDHTSRRQWLRIRDLVSVRIRDRYAGGETVSCVIPGHERPARSSLRDELVVEDGPFAFSYRGNCGYGSTFDYAG